MSHTHARVHTHTHDQCGGWWPAPSAVGEKALASERGLGSGGGGNLRGSRQVSLPQALAHSWHLTPAREIESALAICGSWCVGSRSPRLCRGHTVVTICFGAGTSTQGPAMPDGAPERPLFTGQGPDPLTSPKAGCPPPRGSPASPPSEAGRGGGSWSWQSPRPTGKS